MKPRFLGQSLPFGIAHQGGTDVALGNTEAAFQHAVSLGYRVIETDVQLTSDGVLVVFHDDDLKPLTGADGTVRDRTWLELKEFRIGGEHPIPRFTDILDRFPSVTFNVEPKTTPSVPALIQLVIEKNLRSRICIGSFRDARVSRVRAELGPEVCTSPGPRGASRILFRALLGRATPSVHAALQIPTSYFGIPFASRWLVERFHRQGLQVHVWTINSEAEMNRLLDNGVDAIMSDEITLLRTVLTQRGAWPDSGEIGASDVEEGP